MPPTRPYTATVAARSRVAAGTVRSPAVNATAPTARAMRMYPAWAMLEYASMRLIDRCGIARTFPTVCVTIARIASVATQSTWTLNRPIRKTRNNATIPTFFEADVRRTLIVVGDPWYTSGAPHVERGDGDLETEARDQENERDDQRRLDRGVLREVESGRAPQPHEVRRRADRGRARDAVDQGDAEQDDAGADRPDDEELRGGLRRLLVLLAECDEGKGAQARRLEREEEDEQIGRGRGEHHPDDREEHQGVVLPLVRFLGADEPARPDDDEERHELEHQLEEEGERVDLHLQLRREVALRAYPGRPHGEAQHSPNPDAHHVERHEDRDARSDRGQRPERLGPLPPREAEDRGRERGRHENRLRDEHPIARHVGGPPESLAPSWR